LEELDKGVHPSRAKDLVKMLKEIGKQKKLDIICTTHNATFVDELGPQMIPFISYIKRNEENGCTDREVRIFLTKRNYKEQLNRGEEYNN
jgi:AAA15 family ATPase/GTPase